MFKISYILGVFILGLMLLGYMVKVAFENNVEEHHLILTGNEEENIRIFFISDTHKRRINKKMIRSLKGSIDAVIIGGDFVDERTSIKTIHDNLTLLKELGTIYFIWGNNDREVGEQVLLDIFQQYGVLVVANDAVLLSKEDQRLWLSAIDDTTTSTYSFKDAFAKIQKGDSVIFVSHNPAVFPTVRKLYEVDLMIGGHLHGGQIRMGPFGMRPIGSYKEREGCMTLVSNGYGTTLLPLRLGAKPQCHHIKIQFSKK